MQLKSQFSSDNLAHKASAPRSPAAQLEELNYSTQAMQPKSQFSSGNLAHKASAPRRPGAQQLSLKSSTTQLRPGSPGANLAQAFSPRSLRSSDLKKLNCSTQARQPRNQFNSGIQPTKPQQHSFEELSCSTQTLSSGHATKKSIRFMQNNAKSTSRGESGEIKNKYSLRKRLHMSGVPSPTKKKKQQQQQASKDMCGRSDIRGRS